MSLSPEHEALRRTVYDSFAARGRPPDDDELRTSTGRSAQWREEGLRVLENAHHIVRERGRIVLAHPFASRDFGFSVKGAHTLWWGGCAWDAFAIPQLVDREPRALVATVCPACGTAHAWVVDRQAPPPGDQAVAFPVPAARAWDDVIRTCSLQRAFCGAACVDSWSARSGVPVETVVDIPTLWRLARHWYDGRLDSPYQRRDITASARYLREVGMPSSYVASLRERM
ncbi:hypothetical protein E4V99_04530 [Microbacterium sp. dk485]|uniref:organomercurial lyase n=1 Tax=Microbacterium sp. dk485 TaxID=2560021 RepID=UPI0010735A86|nr:organomercurial lyase [Microbacterium sp. dk485]TFV84335.1 hypothetical protein E4V99_04530 [Microbacterium sp. dk485]